jgi:uncharacterized membrane protein
MSASNDRPRDLLHRINGKLHSVHHVRDDDGQIVGSVVERLKVEFQLEDVGQLVVGAFVMALPAAFAEDAWDLGAELSSGKILLIFITSLIALALFIWLLFYQGKPAGYSGQFVKRVFAAYSVTFVISVFLLWLVDQAPLDDLGLTFSRAVIVAFPASFSATAVDFVK